MNGHANDYVKEWLGAYLDGELADERRAWVEDHLAGCLDCQKELADLRALSTLLQASPAPTASMDDAAFAAQVVNRLPGSSQPLSRRLLRKSLLYAPLGLFGLWAFAQAVLWVSTTLLLTLNLFPQAGGILDSLSPAAGPAGAASWLGGLFSLAGPGQPALDLAGIEWPGSLILINLAVITFLALLFLAWLAGLWSYHRLQTGQSSS